MSAVRNSNERTVPIGEINLLSSTTHKGHNTSVRKWDDFVNVQNMLFQKNGHNKAYPLFKDLTQEFVCGNVLENGSMENLTPPIAPILYQFSQYIFEEKKTDGKPLAPLVRVQYCRHSRRCYLKSLLHYLKATIIRLNGMRNSIVV